MFHFNNMPVTEMKTYEDYVREVEWVDTGHEDLCDGITLPAMVEYAQDLGFYDVRYSYHKVALKDVNMSFYKLCPSWNGPAYIEVTAVARNASYAVKHTVDGAQFMMLPAVMNKILEYADGVKKNYEATVS